MFGGASVTSPRTLILALSFLDLLARVLSDVTGGSDSYGDHPTTAVIYDDSDYVDGDSPVYTSGDTTAGAKKFKMIKSLR